MLSNSPIVDVEVDGQTVTLALWDTCTAEEYERLRPLCYHGANAILLCFAIDSPDSLDSVTTKWVPEVLRYCAGVPLVLVGCKSDLRETSQRPVTWEEVRSSSFTFTMGFGLFVPKPFLQLVWLSATSSTSGCDSQAADDSFPPPYLGHGRCAENWCSEVP